LFTVLESICSLKVAITFASRLTLIAPGAGENDLTVGGVLSTTTTVISVGGSCTFPLLSTARLLIVAGPGVAGVQLKLHAVVPVAAL
jgi:hypothetical protein